MNAKRIKSPLRNSQAAATREKPAFLYRSHKLLLALTVILILGSAPWVRPLQKWLRHYLGAGGMNFFMVGGYLIGGLVFIRISRLGTLPAQNIHSLGGWFLAGLIYSLTLPLPEERIHLMEFGLLGILACTSFGRESRTRLQRLGVPLLFILSIGVLDEAFQWVLPDRVGDLRDVLFNSLGGIWGMALYLAATVKAVSSKQ